MPNVLSGMVHEVGEGFIVLAGGIRIAVSSRVRPDRLSPGNRVTITARLRGSEWVAEDIQVQNDGDFASLARRERRPWPPTTTYQSATPAASHSGSVNRVFGHRTAKVTCDAVTARAS